jgi:hypothetical protein
VALFVFGVGLGACAGTDDPAGGAAANGAMADAVKPDPATSANMASSTPVSQARTSAGGSGGAAASAPSGQTNANANANASANSNTAATSAGAGSSAPAVAGTSPAAMSGAAGMTAMTMLAAGATANAGATGSGMTAACDRACLTGFNDSYLAALTAHDATKLDTAASVRFTENGKELKLTEGLWAVARSLGPYRQDMAEVPAGQTAGFVSLKDDKGDVLLAFRLKVVEHKVTEIETTVCRTGEATFFSPSSLMHNPLYDKEVDPSARMPREALTKIVDSYFNGIETSDGSAIPFADSARRNENGTVTGMGTGLKNVAMFSYIDKIDRSYVLVDEERGNVLPWVLFQIPSGLTGSRTLHLAELFKVEGGKIMDVQAIMVNQPLGTPRGWE